MNTYITAFKGQRVKSKLKALMSIEIWKYFDKNKRDFINSLKNYYDTNGFLTVKQYKWLKEMYDNYVEKYTEQELMELGYV